MSDLEGRYRALLRAYPKRYRAERGDEIVGTLLDAAAPGQRRPTAREAASLILGGLRTRTGANVMAPRPAWRDALHVAAAMAALLIVWRVVGGDVRIADGVTVVAWTVVVAGLAVAVLAGRYRLALPLLALDAYATAHVVGVGFDPGSAWFFQERIVLLCALAVLAWRPRGRPPVTLVLAGLALVVPFQVFASLVGEPFPVVVFLVVVSVVPVLLALLAALVDGRLTAAYGVLLLGSVIQIATTVRYGFDLIIYQSTVVGLGVVSVALGWVSVRRRRRV